MNKFFINNLYDIFKISRDLTTDGYFCDIAEAFARFRADVAAGQARPYNTAGVLPDFDFRAAKAEWDKFGEEGQKQAIEDYDTFVDAHYREACDAFDNGKDACDALVQEAQ